MHPLQPNLFAMKRVLVSHLLLDRPTTYSWQVLLMSEITNPSVATCSLHGTTRTQGFPSPEFVCHILYLQTMNVIDHRTISSSSSGPLMHFVAFPEVLSMTLRHTANTLAGQGHGMSRTETFRQFPQQFCLLQLQGSSPEIFWEGWVLGPRNCSQTIVGLPSIGLRF